MLNYLFRLSFVFLIFLSPLVTFADAAITEVDSLVNVLKLAKEDTLKADILNDIAWKISRSYPDSALDYADEALLLSAKLDYDIGKAIAYRTKGSVYRNQGEYQSSIKMYNESLNIYSQLVNNRNRFYANHGKKGTGRIYNGLGLVEWRQGKYSEALDYFFKSIEIFQSLNDTLGIANCYNNIGLIHWNQENLERAVEYFKKAQEMYAVIDHKNGMGNSFNNIGIIYKNQGDYSTAIDYYKKSLELYTELNDLKGMSSVNNNIGILYRELGNFELAKTYNDTALKLYQIRDDKYGVAMAYGNYANLYLAIGDSLNNKSSYDYYKKAVEYAEKELKIAEEIQALSRLSDAYSHLFEAYEGLKNFENALYYHKQFLSIKDSLFNVEKNKQIEEAEAQFQAAQKQQEIEKQKIDIKRQKTIRNSLVIFSFLIVIVAILIFSRFLLKKRTNDLLEEKNKELQNVILELNKLSIVARETDNAVIIMDAQGNFEWINEGFTKLYGYTFDELLDKRGPNLVSASENPAIKELLENKVKNKKAIHYESQSKNKKGESIWVQTTINPVLNKNNEIEKIVIIESDITELKNAQKEIMQWKEDITDSIAYAKRIQEAMMPDQFTLKKYFTDSFILYKPKDIVSGDFYWYTKIEENIIIVSADCTGHGVPGAFMSLIGISFLNRIVVEQSVVDPEIILEQLNKYILNTLHKTDNIGFTDDGMDLSIVLINTKKKVIEYAGAMNPIYMISNNELREYKANIIAIGEPYLHKSFKKQEIQYTKDDILYLFTDGFADQFGGPKQNKMKYHKFKQKLLEIHKEPLPEQEKILWKYLKKWQGCNEQIDDILVLGLKL